MPPRGDRDIFAGNDRRVEEKQVTEGLLSNIESILLNGTQLILHQVFHLTGFDSIKDEVLKHLVIARICQPGSKVATVDYLKSCFGEDIGLHKTYRYLDKLHSTRQEEVQRISVEHARKISGGKTGLVFSDATTLCFEADESDELHERGFSKDGKHA
ncbi:hypothetical protein FACS1894181_18060 [Bacteroidia bacterium]|nr:hypothetical protein FACS1894181_18060 [Bacteroidia bacterium]